jgi:hypothetical protein
MRLTICTPKNADLVTVTCSGEAELLEGVDVMHKVVEDPRCQPKQRFLVDLAGLDCTPTAEQVRSFVASLPRRDSPGKRKVAVVVSNSFHFGMARMTAILAETRGVFFRVFLFHDEAREWLASSEAVTPESTSLSA